MKKIVTAISLVVFILVVNLSAAKADEKSGSFQLSSVSGKKGEVVAVELTVSDNPGITALQLAVSYPAEHLKLQSIEDKKLFGDAISNSSLEDNPVSIMWYAADSGNRTDNGTIAVFKFEVLDDSRDSEIQLSYNPDNVFDSSINNVDFKVLSGIVMSGESGKNDPEQDEKEDINNQGNTNGEEEKQEQENTNDQGNTNEEEGKQEQENANNQGNTNDGKNIQEQDIDNQGNTDGGKDTQEQDINHQGNTNEEGINGEGNEGSNSAAQISIILKSGGKTVRTITAIAGESVPLPRLAAKGYVFGGWYTAASGGKQILSGAYFSRSTILYSRLNRVSVTKPYGIRKTRKVRGFKVKWVKNTGVKGFEFRYSASKKMKKAHTLRLSKTSVVKKSLIKNKKYYFQIRAYKLDSVGQKVYSGWTAVKSVRTKK